MPAVQVFRRTWKHMDLEIEWGFDPATAGKNYSGRVEIYDGRLAGLRPLEGDMYDQPRPGVRGVRPALAPPGAA